MLGAVRMSGQVPDGPPRGAAGVCRASRAGGEDLALPQDAAMEPVAIEIGLLLVVAAPAAAGCRGGGLKGVADPIVLYSVAV
jgi:hypothetical protein